MAVFIQFPVLALLAAGLFALLWRRDRRRLTGVAGLLWLAYFIWEQTLSMGYGCENGCNIRVDLLVIYPLLALVSVLALWRAFRSGSGA
jgi:hypothetical protein